MVKTKMGIVRIKLQIKRLVIVLNSDVFDEAACIGSKDIPHNGHAPDASRCTCGCIGHVYSIKTSI